MAKRNSFDNWEALEATGPAVYKGHYEDIYKRAQVYRREVSRRLKAARGTEQFEMPAFTNLRLESPTGGSYELILTRQKPGERVQDAINRITSEIARAKRFLNAETSTVEGYKEWRNHLIDILSEHTGLTRNQVLSSVPREQLNEFLKEFEKQKKEVALAYRLDSGRVMAVSFLEWRKRENTTPEERREALKRVIRDDWKRKDAEKDAAKAAMAANGDPKPKKAFSIGSH